MIGNPLVVKMIFSGKSFSYKRGREGFTLVEGAIVLGILILVVGVVFGVAQVARNRADINVASNQILQIVSNMRDLYTSRNVSALSSGAPDMGVLIQSGVFPGEMLDTQPISGAVPSAGAHVHHFWSPTGGHSVLITDIQKLTPASSGSFFVLQYLRVPSDVCVHLVNNNATPGPETGLMGIEVGDVAFKAADNKLPPPKTELVDACMNAADGSGGVTIEWSFKL